MEVLATLAAAVGKPHNQKGSHGGASLLAVFILICRMSGRQRRDAKMRSSKGRHNIERANERGVSRRCD